MPYQGSTPSEVERTVTRPVEEALSTLTGVQRMSSLTRADGVNIDMQFKWGQDTAVKAVEAREKIDAIRADLPSDLTRYQVFKGSTADQPVLNLRVAADHDLTNAYELLDREVKRPLERLPGVARVIDRRRRAARSADRNRFGSTERRRRRTQRFVSNGCRTRIFPRPAD